MRKLILFLGLFLLGLGYMQGQNGIVQGIVTDSITGEALPYVSIISKRNDYWIDHR